MSHLRFFLPLLILALSAGPALAGWVDETVNNSIEGIGRATLSPQSLDHPTSRVDSFASQIATGATVNPQAAHDLLTELRALDHDQLETIAANVSTCVMIDCRGIPSDRVASLADRIITSLQETADQKSNLWSRGVSIISVLIALISLAVNLMLTLSTRRKEKAAA